MGTADLVPGVSGGTVALVLGIYERLVASIREGSSALGSVLRGDLRGSASHLGRVEWRFLIPLLAGVGSAIALLSSVIEHQLEERPTILAGLFLGLVLASVAIAWRKIRAHAPSHWVVAAIVAATAFAVLGLGESGPSGSPATLAFAGAGALAICAMILPGISGSLILLMIGMYAPTLGAVTGRQWGILVAFAVGAVAGLALFSQVLHWALQHHHDNVMAAMVGLMAGATRVLWPWPEGVTGPALGPPEADLLQVALAALLGGLAVWGVSLLATESP